MINCVCFQIRLFNKINLFEMLVSQSSLKKQKVLEDLPNPQNFIPGYTKPLYKYLPEQDKNCSSQTNSPATSRRSKCSNNDKALLSVGMQALSLAVPTARSSLKARKTLSVPIPERQTHYPRSKTFSGSDDYDNRPEQAMLPYKILKKEFSDTKKWKSLEKIYKTDQATPL